MLDELQLIFNNLIFDAFVAKADNYLFQAIKSSNLQIEFQKVYTIWQEYRI